MSTPRKPVGQSSRAKWYRDVHDEVFRKSRIGTVAGHRVINGTQGRVVVAARSTGGSVTVGMYVLARPTAERPLVVEADYLICREVSVRLKAGEETADTWTVGSEDIYIAKQPHHRCSLKGETILGTDYEYTYAVDLADEVEYPQNKKRTVTSEDDTEFQRIIPPWTASRKQAEEEEELEEGEVAKVWTGDSGVEEGEEFIPGDFIFAINTEGTGVVRTYTTVNEEDEEVEVREELTLLDIGSSRQWAKLNEE